MKKKPANPWPKRLKALRERRSLTQAAAAELVGVALRTWISWEHGTRQPRGATVKLLGMVFPELA